MKVDEKIIRDLMIKTFPDSTVPDNISLLNIGDLEDWDSLGNFNLLLAIEEWYQVRFNIDQMESIKSVRDIVFVLSELIESR